MGVVPVSETASFAIENDLMNESSHQQRYVKRTALVKAHF